MNKKQVNSNACGGEPVIGFIMPPDYSSDYYRLAEFPVVLDPSFPDMVFTNAIQPVPREILRRNTYFMEGDEGDFVLVQEPFILNEETRRRAEHWVQNANTQPEEIVTARQYQMNAEKVSEAVDDRIQLYRKYGKAHNVQRHHLIVCGSADQTHADVEFRDGFYFCRNCGSKLCEKKDELGFYCQYRGGHITNLNELGGK